MKLIYCPYCFDIFKLTKVMKKCSCGKVMGRYIDNREAEVSKDAVSIGIGNGSFHNAELNLYTSENVHNREWYIENCKIAHVWLRPNTGIGNPYTRIIQEK